MRRSSPRRRRRSASRRRSTVRGTGSSSRDTRTCSSGATGGSTRARSAAGRGRRRGVLGARRRDDVEFSRTAFDVERAADEILASGWPEAESFVAENIRSAPSRARGDRLFESRRVSVSVGRVGKPHGIEGAFVVEHASEDPERFAVGATLLVDGESRASRRVEARRRPAGDPARPRGRARRRARGRPRRRCPSRRRGRVLRFQLVGLDVEDEDGERSAASPSRRRARRTTSSSSTRASRCRSSTRACGRSISTQVESLSQPGFGRRS